MVEDIRNTKTIYHSEVMAHRVMIYFDCGWDDIYKIEKRFKMANCVNVNGVTCQPVEIADEDWELLRETERRGYIRIMEKQV